MQALQNCIGPTIRIGREILCHPYAGFFTYRLDNFGFSFKYMFVAKVVTNYGDSCNTMMCNFQMPCIFQKQNI